MTKHLTQSLVNLCRERLAAKSLPKLEISDGYSNDHGYFKPLLEATAANGFTIKEVSADKAYLSGENLLTTLRHKAIPYIPFKSNSKAQTNYGPKSTVWTRMLSFYNDNREE